MPIRVKVGGRIVEFPDNTPEEEMRTAIESLPSPSQESAPDEDFSRYGPARLYMEAAMKPSKKLTDVAGDFPLVGGMVGSAVGSLPGAMVGAAGGTLARDLIRSNAGDPRTPRTAGAAANEVGLAAAAQPVFQAVGDVVGRGVEAGGKWLGEQVEPLIRSAVKPTVASLRQAAGASRTGLEAQANRLVRILRREKLGSADAAENVIKDIEQQVQGKLAAVGPEAETVTAITDAPTRAVRYLGSLRRGAQGQMNPAGDVGTVNAEIEAVKRGPLFQESVPTLRRTAAGQVIPILPVPSHRTVTKLATETERVPRANVTVEEALNRARGTSRMQTRKTFGEQKGMSTEAEKALDRAGRDAAKESAPELRPLLTRQGDVIRAKQALDRMQVREGNRDVMSLPGIVGAAPALAHGKLPLLGMLAQYYRNNQLGLGLTADRWAPEIMRNAPTAGAASEQLARVLQLLIGGSQTAEPPQP